MTLLRWEKRGMPSSGIMWIAYCGDLQAGSVGMREDGTGYYAVDSIDTRHIARNRNLDIRSVAAGKKAVERAWQRWIEAAGLVREQESLG